MTLETLGAREEIKELRARYFRTVDCKDWAAFGRLFVPGAVLDLRDDLGRVLHGRDAIVQFVAQHPRCHALTVVNPAHGGALRTRGPHAVESQPDGSAMPRRGAGAEPVQILSIAPPLQRCV